MDNFKGLVQILKRLLAPDGCPWDREQTVQSMRRSLIEEAYEVLEAIDLDDNEKIKEELGDLLLNVVFICNLAEEDGRFTLDDVLTTVNAKLIRRHPHVFGDAVAETSEQVLKQWHEIKKIEKGPHHQKSLLDDIPKDLPSLSKAQKMFSKFKKAGYPCHIEETKKIENEEQVGQALLHLIAESKDKGIDTEHALQRSLTNLGARFREWEKKNQ